MIKIIFGVVIAASLWFTESKDVSTTGCNELQWQCQDKTCIPFDGKCDGVVDCPDGSDESHALCRNMECQSNWFRCAYGACVDGSAPCNGIQECADNSDELLHRCRNVTKSSSAMFKCDDDTKIPFFNGCDGTSDCPDGSDETVKHCADVSCPSFYFQCAYGACVDHGAECNGKAECADNSDEADDLCKPISNITEPIINMSDNKTTETPMTTTFKYTTSSTSASTPDAETSSTTPRITTTKVITTPEVISTSTNTPKPTNMNYSRVCKLPEYPKHGTYIVKNPKNRDVQPDQELQTFYITFTCDPGYGVIGKNSLLCYEGTLVPKSIPECVKYCKIISVEGMQYTCSRNGRKEPCKDFVPPETVVDLECRTPVYYQPPGSRTSIKCMEDGTWDSMVLSCVVDCGKVSSSAKQLMIGGKISKHGEFPWHAAIYRKDKDKKDRRVIRKKQICGGSLIHRTVVVSAAHCFWDEARKNTIDATRYAVGLGKIYRRWLDPKDDAAEYFNVTCIKIPNHYDGAAGNYLSDIAMLKLDKPADYNAYIRPICLDLKNDMGIEMNLGRVAGWGFTSKEGTMSRVLKYVKLRYVELKQCKEMVPYDFRGNIGPDKFCAGNTNGTALCQGDSGGGLVFPDNTGERYFLQGIVSTAPVYTNVCNNYAVTTFTAVSKHADLINHFNCDK